MKRFLCLILLIIILLFNFSITLSAHSGKTDSNGGHYDHSTGEYHYHHGYSAHQHFNGKCPYNYNDKTSQSSGNSSGSGGDSEGVETFIAIAFIVALAVFLIWIYKKSRRKPPKVSSRPKETHLAPPRIPAPPKAPQNTSRSPDSPQETHSGSCDYSRGSSAPPSAYNRIPSTSYIPIPKTNNEQIDVEQILKDNPFLIDIDPRFFNKSQLDLYLESIKTARAKKAVTEYLAVDRLTIDKTSTPVKAECFIYSESFKEYKTTLTKCTCPDHQTRHVVCKHMLALAVKAGAIKLDADKICGIKK